MNKNIINTINYENPGEKLDTFLIPNEIYDLTINRDTKSIQKYFFQTNPKLMFSFIGFNSKLKMSNQLLNDRKCSCFYKMQWITKYQSDNNTENSILLFNQQIQIYKYMIKYWYPSSSMSNMRYLSSIALGIIQQLKQYNYYMNNNLSCHGILCEDYIKGVFNTDRELMKYINFIFSK
jgi:hypothetical protein|tara:strand:+ start:8551 stop:9084 length:534 start_codon:yes stop_codon:yes gene_type:complete